MVEEGFIGHTAELDVINLINSSGSFQSDVRAATKDLTNVDLRGRLFAKNGEGGHKTDIEVIDKDGKRVGISQKKAKRGTRPANHLDRRWLLSDGRYSLAWATALNMPKNISEILHEGIIRKAYNRNANLIDISHNNKIESFLFNKLDIFLEEAFRKGEEILKLFAIQEYNGETELHFFNIDEIIELVKKNIESRGMAFTRVISLGDYIQIQRKAGNGAHIDPRIAKTDPSHPGNQVQIKLMVLKLKSDAISQGLKNRKLSLGT